MDFKINNSPWWNKLPPPHQFFSNKHRQANHLVLTFLLTNWLATLAHFSASLIAVASVFFSSESGNFFSSASCRSSLKSPRSAGWAKVGYSNFYQQQIKKSIFWWSQYKNEVHYSLAVTYKSTHTKKKANPVYQCQRPPKQQWLSCSSYQKIQHESWDDEAWQAIHLKCTDSEGSGDLQGNGKDRLHDTGIPSDLEKECYSLGDNTSIYFFIPCSMEICGYIKRTQKEKNVISTLTWGARTGNWGQKASGLADITLTFIIRK